MTCSQQCVQMPAKIARSVPQPPFGRPKTTVAVQTAPLYLAGKPKNAIIHVNSGVIWGIPAKNPIALVASDSPTEIRRRGRWEMRQIITVATMKGGSGKSTLASCLAVHWHLSGRRTTIIDADPQRSIARLASRERALGGVPVVEDATEDAWKTAHGLAAAGGQIIIDTPGFRSKATLACIAAAEFLLVPVKASPLDI